MTHTTEQLEGLLADAGECVNDLKRIKADDWSMDAPSDVTWSFIGKRANHPRIVVLECGSGRTADARHNAVEAIIIAAPTIAAELIAARKRIAELEAGLTFYAESHSQNPNDGPWGMSSTDYGTRARAALGDAQ